jgi:phospholipid/cholesterol/gamma-HCH transport system substrate-binding protein
MGRNVIETVLGAVVLLIAGLFMAFAFKSADLKKVQGYALEAVFQRADGLKSGSDVMVNGVKVGSVLSQDLITDAGRDQFFVRVMMSINPKVVLPADTIATIANESLLGGRYLSLEIGAEEENIATDGTGRISHTQPPIRLDDLIGKLLFSAKSDSKKDSESKKDNAKAEPAKAEIAKPDEPKPESTDHP